VDRGVSAAVLDKVPVFCLAKWGSAQLAQQNLEVFMIKPYLVQRMNLPYSREVSKIAPSLAANLFVLVDGRFRKEMWGILYSIFRYDYMGSAEFEFGAVPKSLVRMISLGAGNTSKVLTLSCQVRNWKLAASSSQAINIGYICKKEDEPDVRNLLCTLALDDWCGLKEPLAFRYNLAKLDGGFKTVGWHDIENDFMFFIDQRMFCAMKTLIVDQTLPG
jgi:hypothetical protein